MGKTNKKLSTWQLALMTAAAIISLRGLPMMAQEELTMFFYILFATVLFLIPAALVGAELGSAFADKGGGVYTWVKKLSIVPWDLLRFFYNGSKMSYGILPYLALLGRESLI